MVERLISVVMTCFNHRQFAGEAIDSVLGQSYRNLELIVVDDGSSDGTATIVRSIRDPRIKYVWQTNSGPSAATNRAIQMASGRYIALLGGDDVSLKYRLEVQLDQIEQGLDLVFSIPRLIDDRSEDVPLYRYPAFFSDNFDSSAALYRRLFLDGNFLCGPSAFARRDFFERVGVYRPGLIQLQDFDLWIRGCRAGARIARFDEPVVGYRLRDKGANLSDLKHRRRIATELHRIYFDFFDGAPVQLLKEAFPNEIDIESDTGRQADQLFLYFANRREVVRGVGIHKAIQFLDDPEIYQELKNRGFGPAELFRLMDEVDPYGL